MSNLDYKELFFLPINLFPEACIILKVTQLIFVKPFHIIFLLIKPFFLLRLNSSCRYLQRDICSYTYRIKI